MSDYRLDLVEQRLWQRGPESSPLRYDDLLALCRDVTDDDPAHPRRRQVLGQQLAGRLTAQYSTSGHALTPDARYAVAGLLRALELLDQGAR